MNGQTKSYNKQNVIANEFIKRINPYNSETSLNFDLRGYSSYVKEKHLDANQITPKIMSMFIKK